MNTHRNVVFNAQAYRDWIGSTASDSVLGVAPLFHITGLIGHIAVELLLARCRWCSAYRFEPQVRARRLVERTGRRSRSARSPRSSR